MLDYSMYQGMPPKILNKLPIVNQSFIDIAQKDFPVNIPIGQKAPEAGDWGGNITISGTSTATLTPMRIDFIPMDKPSPSYVLEEGIVVKNKEEIGHLFPNDHARRL